MFTKPNEWYQEQYDKYYKSIFEHYFENMYIFLSRTNPKMSLSDLKSFLKKHYKNPKISYIDYPSPGNMEIIEDNLHQYLNRILNKKSIITPSGSTYISSKIRKSHFSTYIAEKKDTRKKVKAEMSYLESKGKEYDARLKHFEQLAIKVGINAISGVTNSHVYFKSIPCYNSITSTARHNVMCGYASIERLLVGNFYFHDFNDTINHVINLLKIYPNDNDIKQVIKKYNLYIPTSNELIEFLVNNTYSTYFNLNKENEKLEKLIYTLNDFERSFVFYAHNLNHLFTYNKSTFLHYLREELLNLDHLDEKIENLNIKIKNIHLNEVDDPDLLICISTFCTDLLKGKTLLEVEKHYPKIKADLLKMYFYIEHKLLFLNDLFDTFLFIYLNIQKPFDHPNMIRRCVILSDTDSNIFTTIHWIKWYTGDIRITGDGIKIHSFIVYIVTKFLEHILALACKESNIEKDDIKLVSMKNEFFYTTFIRTIMGKHYLGSISIKDGVVLPKTKFDFKGKVFVGSDLSPVIRKYIKDFSINIVNEFEQKNRLNPSKLIKTVLDLEEKIRVTTIEKKKNDYLFNVPIKQKEEYENYIISYYFLYMLWEDVFSKKYFSVQIPSKMKSVPLKTKIKYKTMDKNKSLDYMRSEYPDIYERFKSFLEKYPKKSISILLIPTELDIPKELIPILDYKKVISRNIFGIYLLMTSLGIVTPTVTNKEIIFSDIYCKK